MLSGGFPTLAYVEPPRNHLLAEFVYYERMVIVTVSTHVEHAMPVMIVND